MNIVSPNLIMISKHEVATMLRVSLSWVDARIRERTLPHFKVGRRVLFSKQQVESFLANSEITAGNVAKLKGAHAEITRPRESTVLVPSYAEPALQAKWQTGTPALPLGASQPFLCVFQRKGKHYTRALEYLNRHVMPCNDACEPAANAVAVGDDGDYEWTGWFECACDHCDTHWQFTGEVVAWMPFPPFN